MKSVEGRRLEAQGRTRTLVIRNRQRTRVLNLSLLRRIARQILETEFGLTEYQLGFHFVDAHEMARVNEHYLGHEGSTDVITFDHGSSGRFLHAEIFISIPDAVKQSRRFKATWQSEVVRYVIHGVLHLRGYDDCQPTRRREMKREENRLVKTMTSQFAIERLARTRRSKFKTGSPS